MHKQNGQVLLIVILVIIVASTVGLSLASRSIINLRTSTEEAESQKALAAAEAGIERAIQGNVISTGVNILNDNLSNKSQYTVDVQQGDASSFLINGGNAIPKDEGADVWFAQHDASGSAIISTALSPWFVYLYWGLPSEACNTSTAPAAIEAIVVTNNGTTTTTYRFAFDPCDRGNNFALPNTWGHLIGDKTLRYSGDLVIGGNIKNIVFIRVIPIYKDAVVGINTCNQWLFNCNSPLPSQGYKYTATGTSGQAIRKLTVFRGYPQTYLPYLSYGLFVAN